MVGDIAEILVGGATLDDNQRFKIEGYLAHKYSLSANLPSDHKYKNAAPSFLTKRGFNGLVGGGLIT